MHFRFNRNEKLISILEEKFPEFKKSEGFLFNDITIPIIFSDEIPLIFSEDKEFKGRENDEDLPYYPIDLLLGAYFFRTRQIVIYLSGLQKATEALSKIMKYNKYDFYQYLLNIVIFHEIGHYWFHNFIDEAKFKYDDQFDMQNNFESKSINEWISQMFAYLCTDSDQEKDFMIKFAAKQPTEYKSFLKNTDITINEFKEIAGLLHLKSVSKYINCCFVPECSHANCQGDHKNEENIVNIFKDLHYCVWPEMKKRTVNQGK